jgi:hypothetical protein
MALQSPSVTGRALNYHQIEEEMIRLMKVQEELVERLAFLASESAEAEANFKSVFHVSRYNARMSTDHGKVTADMAEDVATFETAEERKTYLAAQAKYDGTKQALLTARSNLESMRSLMASYREIGG